MIRILHTGDLHLDSVFAALDERSAAICREECRNAFVSMMQWAEKEQIDLALFAGDVFDNRYVTRETVRLFFDTLEKWGKPVCIAPGNHDFADEKSIWRQVRLPRNVHVFCTDTLEKIPLAELPVTVWGYGFTAPSLAVCPISGMQVARGADVERLHILVAHADIGGDRRYAPVTAEMLSSFNADYAALGHLHNPPPDGNQNRWAYCGCLNGRDFTETGARGACVAEVERDGGRSRVRLRRIRFSRRRYECGAVDMTGAGTMEDVRARVREAIEKGGWGEDTLLKLTLTGMTETGLVIRAGAIPSDGLFALRIEDETIPCPDWKVLETDGGIRGAFYRKLAPMLHAEDPALRENALRALRYGLAAMEGENITD